MIKTTYFIIAILYLLMLGAYFLRYEISYRFVGTRPEIVKERSLTQSEYTGLREATSVRVRISYWTLIFSMVMAASSGLVWYFEMLKPLFIPIVVFSISVLWTIILVIVSGIHFIPHAPIR